LEVVLFQKMNKKLIKYLLFFLTVNFLGLAVGSVFTDPGVNSNWYINLKKAPWTPLGYIFGVAWTIIGFTFSILMSFLILSKKNINYIKALFLSSLFLNILWNPVFFYANWDTLGLIILFILFILIFYLTKEAFLNISYKIALLGIPYLIWLIVALSLNLYIVIIN